MERASCFTSIGSVGQRPALVGVEHGDDGIELGIESVDLGQTGIHQFAGREILARELGGQRFGRGKGER